MNIIHRRTLAASEDPVTDKAKLVDAYREHFANPYQAAARGYIDDVIRPETTRARLIDAFRSLENKRTESPPKKHGCMPL